MFLTKFIIHVETSHFTVRYCEDHPFFSAILDVAWDGGDIRNIGISIEITKKSAESDRI